MKSSGGLSLLRADDEDFPCNGGTGGIQSKRTNSSDGVSGEGMSLHWLSILEDAALAARSCQSLYDSRHEESFAFSRSSSARSSLARFFCMGRKKRSKSRSKFEDAKVKMKEEKEKKEILIGSGNPQAAHLLRSRRRTRSPGSRSAGDDDDDDDRFESWSRHKIVDDFSRSKKQATAHKAHTLSQNHRSSFSGWRDSGVMDQSSDAGTSFGDEGLLTSSNVGSSRTRQDYYAFYQQQHQQQQETSKLNTSKTLMSSSKQNLMTTTTKTATTTITAAKTSTVANSSKSSPKIRKQKDFAGSDESGFCQANETRRKKSRGSPSTSEEAKQGSASSSQTSLDGDRRRPTSGKKATKHSAHPPVDGVRPDVSGSPSKLFDAVNNDNKKPRNEPRRQHGSSSLVTRLKDSGEFFLNSGDFKQRKTPRASTQSDESSLEISSNLTADSSVSLSSTSSELRPQSSRHFDFPFVDSQTTTTIRGEINTIAEESAASNSDSSVVPSGEKMKRDNKKTLLNGSGEGDSNRTSLASSRSLSHTFKEEIDNLKKLESEHHGCLEYHGPGITVMLPAMRDQSPLEADDGIRKVHDFRSGQTFSSTLPNFLRNYKTEPTSKTLSRTFRWQTPAIYKSRRVKGSNVTFENITYNYGKPPKSAVKRCLLTIVWSFAKTETREDTESIVRVARLHLDYDLDQEMEASCRPVVHERKESSEATKWLEEREDSDLKSGEAVIKEFQLDNHRDRRGSSNFSDTGMIMETVRQMCVSFDKVCAVPTKSSLEVEPSVGGHGETRKTVSSLGGKDDVLFEMEDATRFEDKSHFHAKVEIPKSVQDLQVDENARENKTISAAECAIHEHSKFLDPHSSSDEFNDGHTMKLSSKDGMNQDDDDDDDAIDGGNDNDVGNHDDDIEGEQSFDGGMKITNQDDAKYVNDKEEFKNEATVNTTTTTTNITTDTTAATTTNITTDTTTTTTTNVTTDTTTATTTNTTTDTETAYQFTDVELEDRPFATSSPKSDDFFEEYDLLPHRRVLRLSYDSSDLQRSFRPEQLSPVTKPPLSDKELTNDPLNTNTPSNLPSNFPSNLPSNFSSNLPSNLPSNSSSNLPSNSSSNLPSNSPLNREDTPDTEDERYFSPLDRSFCVGSGEETSSLKVCDSSSLEWFSCSQEEGDKQSPDCEDVHASLIWNRSTPRHSDEEREIDEAKNCEAGREGSSDGENSDTGTLVRSSSGDEEQNEGRDQGEGHFEEIETKDEHFIDGEEDGDDDIKNDVFMRSFVDTKQDEVQVMQNEIELPEDEKVELECADLMRFEQENKEAHEGQNKLWLEDTENDESLKEKAVHGDELWIEEDLNDESSFGGNGSDDAELVNTAKDTSERECESKFDQFIKDENENISTGNTPQTDIYKIDGYDNRPGDMETYDERHLEESEKSERYDMQMKDTPAGNINKGSARSIEPMNRDATGIDDDDNDDGGDDDNDGGCGSVTSRVERDDLKVDDDDDDHEFDVYKQKDAIEDYLWLDEAGDRRKGLERWSLVEEDEGGVLYEKDFIGLQNVDSEEKEDIIVVKDADIDENNDIASAKDVCTEEKEAIIGVTGADSEKNEDIINADTKENEDIISVKDADTEEREGISIKYNTNTEEKEDEFGSIDADNCENNAYLEKCHFGSIKMTSKSDGDDDDDAKDIKRDGGGFDIVNEINDFRTKESQSSDSEEVEESEDDCGEEYDIEEDIEKYFRDYGNSPTPNGLHLPSHPESLDLCDEAKTKRKDQDEGNRVTPIIQDGGDDSQGCRPEEGPTADDKNDSKSFDASSTSSEESRIFSGFRRLFFEFFKVEKTNETKEKEQAMDWSGDNKSSSDSENKSGIESIEESFKFSGGQSRETSNVIIRTSSDNSSEERLDEGSAGSSHVSRNSQFVKSTFYEFHMDHQPRNVDAEHDLMVVKTRHDDSNSIVVQVFARNDLILKELELREQQEFDRKEQNNGLSGKDEEEEENEEVEDEERIPDTKVTKCPSHHTGTGRASRSTTNSSSDKPGQQSREGFLSPSGRRGADARSRSPSGSPNRRNPSADKRRARNRLLAQAEVSPPMETMEENFGFLPNRVTVQITPSKNDQITATLNTVESFYRMIGQEMTPELLAQLSGMQASYDLEQTSGSFHASGFMANHAQMRNQLERVFRTSENSRLRSDGTSVDREEVGQEDRQRIFEGKWVPVYDCTDKDGNVIKLPGMATAEWMTLTDGRGQYASVGGGQIFARKRRNKIGADEAGTDGGSGEENFLEHPGPETEHLTLTSTRESRMRLIYFLDKTEEASAAATKLVSDVISSPDTEGSMDGLNEEEPGLTDQILMIFSSSDLAAGAFGGVGGDPVPEPWDESVPVVRGRHNEDEVDVAGVIESRDNDTRTPELWTRVDEEEEESKSDEERRAEFGGRRWFSEDGAGAFERPSRDELKRRHKSIEDGISSFDSKINNLNDRIQRLRRTPGEGHTTDSFKSTTSHAESSSFYQSLPGGSMVTSGHVTAKGQRALVHGWMGVESGYGVNASETSDLTRVRGFIGQAGVTSVASFGLRDEGLSSFDPVVTAHEYAEMISIFKFCSVQIKKAHDARRPIMWTDDRPPVMVLPPRWVWGGPFAHVSQSPLAVQPHSSIVHLSEQRDYSPVAVAIVSDNFYVVATSNVLYSQPGTIAVSVSRRHKSRRKRRQDNDEGEYGDDKEGV